MCLAAAAMVEMIPELVSKDRRSSEDSTLFMVGSLKQNDFFAKNLL